MMIKGFSLLEVLVALSVSLGVLGLVLTNIGQSMRHSRKVIDNQQKLESIFHTMEMIKSDLTKCGMRLQEAARFFNFPLFENNGYSFKVTYGLEDEALLSGAAAGANTLNLNRNEFFQKKKKVVIFDPGTGAYEIKKIAAISGDQITLTDVLQNPYPKNAIAVALKEVEYKLYSSQNTLKRKVNTGYFQPLVEEVTNFQVTFYPESLTVLYMIEVGSKEQLRGYIYLKHMAGQ
jgi:prepilin-type N-terminal cleavage/methylation domain-containing protein